MGSIVRASVFASSMSFAMLCPVMAAEPDVLIQLHPASLVSPTTQVNKRLSDTVNVNPPNVLAAPNTTKSFDIGVQSWTTSDSIDSIVQKLVDVTALSSPEFIKLDHDIAKMRSPAHKAAASTKDSLNHTFSYQATDPSSRAGRMILDEPLKKYNLPMAEYQRQKIVDKIHSDVVAALMQISLGLGLSDKASRAIAISEGVNALKDIVGESETRNAVLALHSWLKKAASTNKAGTSAPKRISILEQEAQLQSIIKESTSKDAVIIELTKKLNRYAHPGAIKAGTSKVVETTLSGIAMIGPGFAIPLGAEGILDGYLQITGGSEEGKLEKELSISQRIKNRVSVLSREAAMGLENYRLAQMTDNAPLRYMSQGLLCSMTSKAFIAAKLRSKETVPEKIIVPSIVETIDEDD